MSAVMGISPVWLAVWRRNFLVLWLNYLSAASIAFLLIYNTARVTPAFLFVIVPVITTRTEGGKVRIHVEDAVYVRSQEEMGEALGKLARVLEKYVRAYPEQWLLLQPAFWEDTHGAALANEGELRSPDDSGPSPARGEGDAATARAKGAA